MQRCFKKMKLLRSIIFDICELANRSLWTFFIKWLNWLNCGLVTDSKQKGRIELNHHILSQNDQCAFFIITGTNLDIITTVLNFFTLIICYEHFCYVILKYPQDMSVFTHTFILVKISLPELKSNSSLLSLS